MSSGKCIMTLSGHFVKSCWLELLGHLLIRAQSGTLSEMLARNIKIEVCMHKSMV